MILSEFQSHINLFIAVFREDLALEDQDELDAERRERMKAWHRRKDEETRRRLLAAYRPYFPNDVFSKKQGKTW